MEQTKKCKECYSDIPVKAKKCPNCRTDQRSWGRRHPIVAFFLVLLGFGIVMSSILGGASNAVEEKQKEVASNQPIVFDIPNLLNKTIQEIEAELGTPSYDKEPTDTQISLGTTEWDKNWEKDGQGIMVTYYLKSGKVKDIFLEAKGDIYANKDKYRLLRVGNLVENSPVYTVDFVEQIYPVKDPTIFTGITVTKTQKYSDFDICSEAKYLVTQALKSPSTADFPSTSDCVIQRFEDETSFKVSSYVDSENSFGAMIRTNWTVKFSYVNGGTRTQPESIVMDGETVYSR